MALTAPARLSPDCPSACPRRTLFQAVSAVAVPPLRLHRPVRRRRLGNAWPTSSVVYARGGPPRRTTRPLAGRMATLRYMTCYALHDGPVLSEERWSR